MLTCTPPEAEHCGAFNNKPVVQNQRAVTQTRKAPFQIPLLQQQQGKGRSSNQLRKSLHQLALGGVTAKQHTYASAQV